MNVHFDPILPKEIPTYDGNLVFTTMSESPGESTVPLLYEDILDYHPTVIRGMMIQRLEPCFEEEELVIGVDPGKLIGLSVSYYGHEIERSVHSSIRDLVVHIIEIFDSLRARRKIVRIGDGDIPTARVISRTLNLRFCSSYHLEFVDEKKTSPRIKNHNRRGKRDMLAAKFISQRKGHRYAVLPLSITG